MKNFVEALISGKGFNFLTNYQEYSELTRDQMRSIAKELIYAIEESGLLESEIAKIYETVEENLSEQYDYEFE